MPSYIKYFTDLSPTGFGSFFGNSRALFFRHLCRPSLSAHTAQGDGGGILAL
jgi:hypothetical protein